jgi:putative permease
MFAALSAAYFRYLGRPEATLLLIVLFLFSGSVLFLSHVLLPLFISIVLAYLLEQVVVGLTRLKCPRKAAVIIVFVSFIFVVIAIMTFIIPILVKQISNLLLDLPALASESQNMLETWLRKFSFISGDQISMFITSSKAQVYQSLKSVLTSFLTFIPSLVTGAIYFVLVPLIVYFLLIDKDQIISWCKRFMPERHPSLGKIWDEIYLQIGNYTKGKIIEVIINAVLSYIAFAILDLQYALLLALAVGISVLIPYLGAVIVTIPVVLIGLFQWGFTPHFIYLLIAYSCIVAFDGTILTAVLFSEAVALHPLAILLATLIFGGLWGIWGMFFAIPLASTVKALITYWPMQYGEAPR